jgi:hypothetical protein
VDIVSDERCVEDEREPLARQEEQKGDKGVRDHFGEDKLVELVAEVNGVDVVWLLVWSAWSDGVVPRRALLYCKVFF